MPKLREWSIEGAARAAARQSRQRAKQEIYDPVVLICQHYWVIESPAGPTSEGICKKCGTRRMFFNHVDPEKVIDKRSRMAKPLKTYHRLGGYATARSRGRNKG